MKNIMLPLLSMAIILCSCRSMTSFDTPNSFRNMQGTVFLSNGKTVDGKIIVNSSNRLSSPVKVYTEGDRKPMQFGLSDVSGYSIRGDYYALKQVRGNLSLGRQQYFMKRISRPESRIHLFEHIEKVNSTNSRNVTTSRYETQYFLQMPGDASNEVWSLSGSRFVPNFDEKMSKLVADCPSLAARISSKAEGYFYAQVTMFGEKRADVLLRIIDDYNACGR
ncbi:MAG TPA: hypothetical protein VFR58_02285 [Flavisolibacter sp.]|nr:hypothetical protein [Flavisolibacter sp.]